MGELDELETEFLGWQAWHGVSGLFYARRKLSSPPVVLRAETIEDLREQMKAYLAARSQGPLS